MVTYGAMSRSSLKVPNKFIIFKDLSLRGYWLTRWMQAASHAQLHDVMRPLAQMISEGDLTMAVDEVIPLKHFQQAIERAQTDKRNGKVVLDLATV